MQQFHRERAGGLFHGAGEPSSIDQLGHEGLSSRAVTLVYMNPVDSVSMHHRQRGG